MENRRGFLRMLSGSPLVAAAAVGAIKPPPRRVTPLPGGGSLIEDATFTDGIRIEGGNNLQMLNCNVVVNGNMETGIYDHGLNNCYIGCYVSRADMGFKFVS